MPAMDDCSLLKPAGHIRMWRGDELLYSQSNMVVDAFRELVLRALMREDTFQYVHLVNTNGAPIGKSLRSLGTPVAVATIDATGDLAPTKSLDLNGQRTIGTWTARYSSTSTLTYDAIGLVSSTGLLCAATQFPAVTLTPSENIAIQWSISLTG